MRFLIAPLLLFAGPVANAQHLFGQRATFTDGPERREVYAQLTYVDVPGACDLVVSFSVDRDGMVVSAEVLPGQGACTDTTALNKALRSVRGRVFNAAPGAPAVQHGRVHWTFHKPEPGMLEAVPLEPGALRDSSTVHECSAVQRAPQFPGGTISLNEFVQSSLRYPADAMEIMKEGIVRVSFIVAVDGRLSEISVEQSLSPSTDLEALRIVRSMPRWSPGVRNGHRVRTRCSVPVEFRIRRR